MASALHNEGGVADGYSSVFLAPAERERLVAEAGARLGTDMATLSLIGLRHEFVLASTGVPLADWNDGLLPLAHSLGAVVVRTGRPLVIEDGAMDPAYRDHPAVRVLGLAAYLGVPVRRGPGVAAALAAMALRPRRFPDEAVGVLEALARRVAPTGG